MVAEMDEKQGEGVVMETEGAERARRRVINNIKPSREFQ